MKRLIRQSRCSCLDSEDTIVAHGSSEPPTLTGLQLQDDGQLWVHVSSKAACLFVWLFCPSAFWSQSENHFKQRVPSLLDFFVRTIIL